MYVCMYRLICINMHVCMYTYIHIHINKHRHICAYRSQSSKNTYTYYQKITQHITCCRKLHNILLVVDMEQHILMSADSQRIYFSIFTLNNIFMLLNLTYINPDMLSNPNVTHQYIIDIINMWYASHIAYEYHANVLYSGVQ